VIFKNDAIARGRAGQSARFIDEVYNRPRLHAALSYLSPQQFEHRTGRRSNQRPDRCPGRGAQSSRPGDPQPPSARTRGPRRFLQWGLSGDRPAASAREGERSCWTAELRELYAGARPRPASTPKCIVVVRLFISSVWTSTRSRSLRPMRAPRSCVRSCMASAGDRWRDRHSVFGHRARASPRGSAEERSAV
jgi:hypothetical protein